MYQLVIFKKKKQKVQMYVPITIVKDIRTKH